jgi:hypothetical protein
MNKHQLLCSLIDKACIAKITESVSQPCVGMAYKYCIEYD